MEGGGGGIGEAVDQTSAAFPVCQKRPELAQAGEEEGQGRPSGWKRAGSGWATGSLSRRDTPILGTQPDPYHPLSAAESLTQVSDISLICRQWFTMRQHVQGRTPKAHSSLQPRQSMTRPLDTLLWTEAGFRERASLRVEVEQPSEVA